MKINENGKGILIQGEDFQYIKAVRKPNSNCKISQEIWFSGKAKAFQTKKDEDVTTKKC